MAIFDYIKEALGLNFRNIVRETEEEISRRIRFQADRLRIYLIKQIVSIFVLMLAGLFLILALIFFGIEYLGMSKTISFLIIGSVLLIVGIIIKIMR